MKPELDTGVDGVASHELFGCIIVDWVDSLQPVVGWHMIDDLPILEAAVCKTVGWLVAENDEALMIAQNVADPKSTQMQAGGLMRIPKCCVTRITSFSCASSRLVTKETPPSSSVQLPLASCAPQGRQKLTSIFCLMFVSLAWWFGGKRFLGFLSNVKHIHR